MSPTSQPHRRIRFRYQRGPATSGSVAGRGRARGASWGRRVIVSIRRAYGPRRSDRGHPVPGPVVFSVTAVASIAAWTASPLVGAMVGALAWLVTRRWVRRPSVALMGLLAVGAFVGWRAHTERLDLAPDRLGPFTGWVRLVDDPQPLGGATRVLVEVDGERFEMWARGRGLSVRVDEWQAGEYVYVRGERVGLDADRRARVAWQHVVGEFEYEWASDRASGGPVARASNRVRGLIEGGSQALPEPDSALFRGLVIGDDRDQPAEMIARFRATGLSHLTAVSGQNVAFVLAASGPLLRRLRPLPRWALTLGLIAWFVALTRFEPSIVRAGAMAAISATGFLLGRPRAPARMLAGAVVALLAIDPLLVRSVGFQLSVGATAGVAVLGPRIAARLARLGPLAVPVGVTLGAQLGVALPQLLVFGSLPLVALPANLLAVPVAGAVMLYGLPAALVAGLAPDVDPVVMLPCRLGVRWVDTVATVATRLEPTGPTRWLGWAALLGALLIVAAPPSRWFAGVPAGYRRGMNIPQPPQPDPEVPPPFHPAPPGEPEPTPLVPDPAPVRPMPQPEPPLPGPDTPQPAPPIPLPEPGPA